MKRTLAALLLLSAPVSAHRLDEYLQATLIGPTRTGVDIEIQLTPGVAVFPQVQAVLDRNLDGRLSPDEQTTYANWVARDLDLRIDGQKVPLKVVSAQFSPLEQMREGLGSIQLKMHADKSGSELRLENRHLPELSAWLINCLSSPGDDLTVGEQVRDELQRSLSFHYSFKPRPSRPFLPPWLWIMLLPVAILPLLLVKRLRRPDL